MRARDAASMRIGVSMCLLVAPLTLSALHAWRLHVAYLRAQTFLTPHPQELMPRNHV